MYKIDDVNVVGQLYLPSLSAFTYVIPKVVKGHIFAFIYFW